MSINRFAKNLVTFGFSQATQRVDILRQVNTHAIRLRLSATVTIAGGADDGTVVTEGIQRFLSRVRVAHDGPDIVQPLSGRVLSQLLARSVAQIIAPSALASAVAQVTILTCDFVIPFARNWMGDPVKYCVLPGTLPVRQELALYVDFDQSVANAASAGNFGTGAFVTGGTDVVTLSAVSLTVEQIYSRGLVVPQFLPRIEVRSTEQFSAANAQLTLALSQQANPYDSVLFSYLQDAAQDVQDGFNFVTLEAGSTAYLDRVDAVMLQREDLGLFPAAERAGQVGRIFIRHADNGRWGSVVEPARMPDARYTFDVDAPAGNPGVIQAVFLAGVKLNGITTP
jgi:hypothetical protein